MLSAAQKNSDAYVGLFLRRLDKEGKEITADTNPDFYTDSFTNIDQIYKVGVFAQVRQINRVATGAHLFVTGMRRINALSIKEFGPPAIANVDHWKAQRMIPVSKEVKAYSNELLYASRYGIMLSTNMLS